MKAALVRIGLGLAALSLCAVWLWPSDASSLEPEKGYAFVAATAIWLFVEFFEGRSARSYVEHDSSIAAEIFSLAGEDQIRFLKEHDFGVSWHGEDTRALFALADRYKNPSLEFEDRKLRGASENVRLALTSFVQELALNSWDVAGKDDLYSAVSDQERVLDERGPESDARVRSLNQTAEKAAAAFETLYRACRHMGATLR